MSIVFSESTTKTGICELIDDLVGTDTTSYSLAKKARDVNLALDKVFSIIFRAGGSWQFDDANHTDYPILTTNLVSGQRDYTFTEDSGGNLILDIYKVMVKGSDGVFRDLTPIDQQGFDTNELNPAVNHHTINDGQNGTGTPTAYDKTGNGIFLDLIPNYNSTGGLKIFVNREASYFTSADTTKVAGFAGLFHEYLALRPAYMYAQRHGLENANRLKQEMLEMELGIEKYYGQRERDTSRRMTAGYQTNQ